MKSSLRKTKPSIIVRALGQAFILPTFACLAVLSLTSLSHAEVYRSVDENGTATFTDAPAENSQAVEIETTNQFSGQDALDTHRSAVPQFHQPLSKDTPPTSSNANEDVLAERIKACEASNKVDCSTATIQDQIDEENYRQTEDGRKQQHTIHNGR